MRHDVWVKQVLLVFDCFFATSNFMYCYWYLYIFFDEHFILSVLYAFLINVLEYPTYVTVVSIVFLC